MARLDLDKVRDLGTLSELKSFDDNCDELIHLMTLTGVHEVTKESAPRIINRHEMWLRLSTSDTDDLQQIREQIAGVLERFRGARLTDTDQAPMAKEDFIDMLNREARAMVQLIIIGMLQKGGKI